MAIPTINQQPSTITPCYNGQWFEATSSSSGSNNFIYTVKCTDVITSGTSTYQIKKGLSSEMIFDGSNFAQKYIKHYVPNNVYGWQRCTDGYRKIRANIGSTYGTTPVYASGTDVDYYVWNAALKWLDWPNYSSNDFTYKTTNRQILNKSTTNLAYADKSLFVYVLGADATNTTSGLRIIPYDVNGNLLGTTSYIDNPSYLSGDYTYHYVCCDVGRKGLDNIASGLVTGTYPILPAGTHHYQVIDKIGGLWKTVTFAEECRYTPYVLHFLDQEGCFETMNFSKLSETTVQADKTYYKKTPYTLSSNTWSYSTNTPNEFVLSSNTTTKIKINSDWMTEDEIDRYRYIISSPRVYLDMGSTTGLIPVRVNTNQWLVNKKWNNRVYSVTLDIEYTHKDTFQNG